MITEIKRVPILREAGSFIVQRINGNSFETLKETTVNSGEIPLVNDELTTIETITITRKITKTEF